MNQEEFRSLFEEAAAEVADRFYPKNEYQTTGIEVDLDLNGEPIKTERSQRRGEFLRDQAVLYSLLSRKMEDAKSNR